MRMFARGLGTVQVRSLGIVETLQLGMQCAMASVSVYVLGEGIIAEMSALQIAKNNEPSMHSHWFPM